jgi:arginine/lysine/ornithine decarboxylase
MNTPVCDYLKKYSEKNMLRLHMPAHKGKNIGSPIDDILKYDITEIKGADSLFEADGIISESEKNASELFKTVSTIYSVQGSTLCIQTMLALMKTENRHIISARNSHRAFLNACALLDLEIEWIYPEYNSGIIGGIIKVSDIEEKLKNSDGNSCVYITSPDYLGNIADIKSIAQICHKYNAVLLVDNAHGACLGFLQPSKHPAHLGADMCCDSAHKMLPAVTGTAYLHINNERYAKKAKSMMSVFASTSPSYIQLASLDYCNLYISEKINDDIIYALNEIKKIKSDLKYKYSFIEGEPFHITITDINGNDMAEKLRQYNIECEYSDFNCIVLLLSPVNTAEDFKILKSALENINPQKCISEKNIKFPAPVQAVSLKKAFFSPSEEISIYKAEGRICSSLNVPCPPAIPIAVSGEIISAECIEIYRQYNIKTINVIMNQDI